MKKLIISIALVSCCIAAPVSNSVGADTEALLETSSELPPYEEIGEEDLHPAVKGIISDFIRGPYKAQAVTASGQPIYIIQTGPFPLLARPFLYRLPWGQILSTTTTTTTSTTTPTTTTSTTTPTTTTTTSTTTPTTTTTTTTAAPAG